jgi:hypothetical protein
MKESDVEKIHTLAYDVRDFIEAHDKLSDKLEFEKHRADELAADKASLSEDLGLEKTKRTWAALNDVPAPKDVRVLVRGKNTQGVFATWSGATWASGRVMLDFVPLEWMRIPD